MKDEKPPRRPQSRSDRPSTGGGRPRRDEGTVEALIELADALENQGRDLLRQAQNLHRLVERISGAGGGGGAAGRPQGPRSSGSGERPRAARAGGAGDRPPRTGGGRGAPGGGAGRPRGEEGGEARGERDRGRGSRPAKGRGGVDEGGKERGSRPPRRGGSESPPEWTPKKKR